MEVVRALASLRITRILVPALLAAALATADASAQERERVRVFLDCQTRGCSFDEFRTEIGFVDWVRDRTVADVHVILTSQDAGAGRQFVFDFLGQGGLEGMDVRLDRVVPSTDTRDEELGALTRTFRAGLVPYVARRGYIDALEIRDEPGLVDEAELGPVDDPWNLWVFTISADIEADGEEQQRSLEIGGRVSANRTTSEWRIDVEAGGSRDRRHFELSDGPLDVETDEWEVNILAARSLSAHWSAGTVVEASKSTRLNRELGGRSALALEWDFFPYEEANRRQLILHYQVGFSRVLYEDTTLFDQTEESLYDHRLVALYESRQPWGDASVSVQWSNLLRDWSKHRLSTGIGAEIRLFRGLNLEIRGNYDRIRDQIYLPARGLTDEDKLLERRQLATGYEYGFEVGLSYRFGSIFNNVVNNRFPSEVLGSDDDREFR